MDVSNHQRRDFHFAPVEAPIPGAQPEDTMSMIIPNHSPGANQGGPSTHLSPYLLYTVDEGAEFLRLSVSTTRTLLRTGALHSIKIGARRLIPAAALEDFISRAGGAK